MVYVLDAARKEMFWVALSVKEEASAQASDSLIRPFHSLGKNVQ